MLPCKGSKNYFRGSDGKFSKNEAEIIELNEDDLDEGDYVDTEWEEDEYHLQCKLAGSGFYEAEGETKGENEDVDTDHVADAYNIDTGNKKMARLSILANVM